jgi:hypothetical protein
MVVYERVQEFKEKLYINHCNLFLKTQVNEKVIALATNELLACAYGQKLLPQQKRQTDLKVSSTRFVALALGEKYA